MWRRCAAASKNMALPCFFLTHLHVKTAKNDTFLGKGKWGGGSVGLPMCSSAATAMTGISQIILDYNATLTPCRARSRIINLTAPLAAAAARTESQTKAEAEGASVCRSLVSFYVYSAVFSSSSLRVSECLSTSHRMN